MNSTQKNLTLVEREELERLKETNAELERELRIKQSILSEEQKEANKDAKKYFTTKKDIPNLNQEIVSLKEEIENLNKQIEELEGNHDQAEPLQKPEQLEETELTASKVSIFDLDTFRGDGCWNRATSKYNYTDTYDNEYKNAYYASHYSSNKDELSHVPTYLLDYKYSVCEGKIAWCKQCKDYDGNAWIDFYSGDKLIYSTESIAATDRAITFSFSVEGLETLTIVKNSDRNSLRSYTYIIYPYLNLIE